ncbi:PPOX class F420-dependent oxidoreductase [Spongisporangium articulatum]|uniref:PPOX class F420-dependent oxidoreductase n=1 Tax=Spongisporangium articulatum TaxID=3362603 RepID=A0ABW8ALC9_9ACTN
MSEELFPDDVRTFLTEGHRTGMLAWVARDGRPLAVPVWFVMDGDDLVFNTGDHSAKAHAMQRDPRVCLTVDLPEPPYKFVQVQGTVTISDDLAEMLPFSTAIGGRYMGADRAEEFGRRNAVPGELLVRLRPSKVNFSMDMTGGTPGEGAAA